MAAPTMWRAVAFGLAVWLGAAGGALRAADRKRKKPYRLKPVDLRRRVIWGAECRQGEDEGLAFGGQDQVSDDGRPHTRVLVGGAWKAIHTELRRRHPLQAYHARAWALRGAVKDLRATVRRIYFRGLTPDDEAAQIRDGVEPERAKLVEALNLLLAALGKAEGLGQYERGQARFAMGHLAAGRAIREAVSAPIGPARIRAMREAQVHFALAAEALDAEPPARALSPIVFDRKTGLYVLFGGDHLDYLTNDTWVFDGAARRWRQRHPESAPAPRAHHTLTAPGDGRVRLAGGCAYASNTDYCGGQYVNHDDGEYVYDAAADAWTGPTLVPSDSRTYRTGPFHPDYYLEGGRPDAGAFEARLAKLPTNEWVTTNPPRRPRLNRDWGTAVLDTRRDMILRWSGGHSAHGGTDVPHFHLATNRWELAYPVEFPLGQLYSNTSYPKGFNLNRRAGMTGHTYQNYAFDPVGGRMIQTGHPDYFYVYDPDKADWVARGPKPKGMNYGSCFYDLTLCTTPRGIVCWTKEGRFFRYEAEAGAWKEMKTTGVRPPGARVDSSTIAFDAPRNRALLFRKEYGRRPYDGQVWALDLGTSRLTALSPASSAGAAKIAWIDRCCYAAAGDVVLMATYLQPGKDWTPTPAYDCAANCWIALDLNYGVKQAWNGPRRAFPHGHSAGVMYDPKRKLVWGTDTNSQVYVLRLDAKAAGRSRLN